MPPHILPIVLLSVSNLFMTLAWYGHLKFKTVPLLLVIFASWGIALFEYMLAVPANRWGHSVYSAAELKTIQEVITLIVFAGFSVWVLKEPLGWAKADRRNLLGSRRRRKSYLVISSSTSVATSSTASPPAWTSLPIPLKVLQAASVGMRAIANTAATIFFMISISCLVIVVYLVRLCRRHKRFRRRSGRNCGGNHSLRLRRNRAVFKPGDSLLRSAA
jgi:uncharacterized protein